MSDLSLFLLTFFCGAMYECACVFWVHYSEKYRVMPAMMWSCIAAYVTVVGLGEALHRGLYVLAYVSGFGVGTGAAILVKRRWLRRG